MDLHGSLKAHSSIQSLPLPTSRVTLWSQSPVRLGLVDSSSVNGGLGQIKDKECANHILAVPCLHYIYANLKRILESHKKNQLEHKQELKEVIKKSMLIIFKV